ncbi:MAG: hypothetical protein KGH58_00800 [Candidatus Micrarchaeota archaeon]|nr:hypothetical protein [Candidatus Micrarchaeota archaeon]
MSNLDGDISRISAHLADKQKRFDAVMDSSREMIREAGQIITLLHNNRAAEAKKRMAQLKKAVMATRKIDDNFRYHTLQAYQEYVEAACFFSIKTKGSIPRLSELGVDNEAYILGLMDCVGELKREVFESLNAGDTKSANGYFDFMKLIYDSTRSIRFAEVVLGGFRKKQDVARIQIESAGSEILSFKKR